MTALPKTIQIFLPDGDPRSVRLAEITSRTVQAVQVPRGVIERAASRDELRQVGVYFLFGGADEGEIPPVYIGEAEDCWVRLGQHHKDTSKDFWTQAVVITSKTQKLDKGQGRWLEWFCTREATAAKRYNVENLCAAKEPHLTEPVKADLYDTFDTARVLVATLGFPLFETLHQQPEGDREVFTCKGRGVTGRGEYVKEGFLVLAESEAAKTETQSSQGGWATRIREKLVQGGVLIDTRDHYTFAKDHLFKTPSAAAVAVLGRNTNGWTKWKNEAGQTLDERHRQNVVAGEPT